MIFSHGLDDKVRDGTKTQTRRLSDRSRHLTQTRDGEIVAVLSRTTKRPRKLWVVGRTYAIQSGRSKKGNGRFRITKIRKERVQDISWGEIRAEGFPPTEAEELGYHVPEGRERFISLWNSIHKKPGTRWKDNPEVWVLEMEHVDGS